MDGGSIGMDAARPEMTDAELSEEKAVQWPNWSWSPLQARPYPQRPVQKCSWGPFQTPQASNWPWSLRLTGSVGYNPRIRMSWGSLGPYSAGTPEASEGKFASGKVMKSKRKKISPSKRRALRRKRLFLSSLGKSVHPADISFSTTNSVSTGISSPVRSSSRASTNRWSRSPSPIDFHEDVLVPNTNRSRSLSPTLVPVVSLANKSKSSPPIFMRLASLSSSKLINNVKPRSRSVLDIFLQSLPDSRDFHSEIPEKNIHQPLDRHVGTIKPPQRKIILNRSPLHLNDTAQPCDPDNCKSSFDEVSAACDDNTSNHDNEGTNLADETQENVGSDYINSEESSDQITCLINSDGESDMKEEQQLSFKNNIASSELATPPIMDSTRQWNFSPVPLPSLSDDSLPWNPLALPFITPIGSFSDSQMGGVESSQVLGSDVHPNGSSGNTPSSKHDKLEMENELSNQKMENELSNQKNFDNPDSQHENILQFDTENSESSSTEMAPQFDQRLQSSTTSEQNPQNDENSLVPVTTADYPVSGSSSNQKESSNVLVGVDKQPVSSASDSQSSSINVSSDNHHLTEQMLIQESQNSQLNLSSPEEFDGEQPISPHSEKAIHLSENQPEGKLLAEILSHANMSSLDTEHRPLSQSESKSASTDHDSDLVTHSACTTLLPVSPCLSSPKSSSTSDSSNAHVDIHEPMSQNVDVISKSPSHPSENRNTEAKSSSPESKDDPSRSPSPSSEESCTRSRSPSPSSEGSDPRSRSPSLSSQRSSSRSRSPSQSSERSDSRSRSPSPSTDESDDWSRSSSPSSERIDVRSRSPSPSSRRSYARSKSPSPSTDGIDTGSRSPFSSPERSFTTSVRQAIENISLPPQKMQSDLEPTNKDMAVTNEQAEPLPLEKSFSTICQLSWIPLPERSPSPCDKSVSFCQTTSTLQDEDEKSMSSDRLEDEVMEHENFSHIADKAPHSCNDDQFLEQDIPSKNVELAKSPVVEKPSSPPDESVHSNIESGSFTMPDSSVISNYSSGDLLAEDISRSPPNSPRGNDNTVSNNSVCEDMLLSHDSTAASLELSKNKIADLDLSTDTALSTAARSENLVESEEPQYPCQVNQESTMEKRISSGIALVTPCPVGEKSPDPVTEKSEFLPSDDSDDSNLAVNESETNNVSSETVMDKTKVVSTDSSVLDAPMSLSKDTSENSYLVPEETPITESLANKSNYLSVVDNDSETNFSAIHNTSHFQEEVLAAKEKEDNSSDKVEEFIHMAENSPSDSCKLNNTSDIAEYSPAPSLYSSVENSPISMCNSPPSPSSDEDMNSSEDSLPFTFRPGRNYDLNDVDTEADLPINNEPQETDITPDMEQDINKINRKGLKRGRSPSPVALNRDISSVATDSHNSSDESEDQVLNCQKRLKISSSGGRLVMNKQACKLFAAQDSKKQVLKRQKSVRGMLIELYESSGHKGIFTPKLYHQKRRLRTITTRSLVKKLKRRTPNHDLKYISQKRMDLIKAVEEGNMPKIQELIQDMGPAVREEKTGSTLLHVAVAHNQVDAVLFLLRLISPNVVNNEGETPAHLAAFMGHTQILRILLTDEELCYEKKNRQGRTYTNLLSAPLCDAVLGKDRNKAQELLRLGADPDYDVGDVVEGQLPPDVRVSTPRQLATDLGLQDILQIFPKKKCDIAKKVREPDVVFTSNSVISNSDEGKQYPDPVEIEVTPAQEPPEGDVYPVNTEPRGFVCILDYNAFRDRQDLDLEGSMQDISNLASIFSKMGYAGEIYSSPTADETTEILQNVREKDILKEVGCLTVVVNSHGVGEDRFLTSDLKSLDISRTCGLFKDSECTHMVNKPKIFLFNTGSGLYRESKKARYSKPLTTRVSEPLRDALCLFSSHSGFASWAYSDKGTPFYLAFCNTLAKHAHSMEINDLFRELLKEYGKTSPVTVPELRNIGFSKKFFFNPVP